MKVKNAVGLLISSAVTLVGTIMTIHYKKLVDKQKGE